MIPAPRPLLAVDLGVRTGLACFDSTGRLSWCRSQNFGNAARLRRAVPGLLAGLPGLRWLVLEGGGDLGMLWRRIADRRGLTILQVQAEAWRETLLLEREQRSGKSAKENALTAARRVIAWSAAPQPTSLRHDAAEAVLAGLWGAVQVGLLEEFPPEVVRG